MNTRSELVDFPTALGLAIATASAQMRARGELAWSIDDDRVYRQELARLTGEPLIPRPWDDDSATNVLPCGILANPIESAAHDYAQAQATPKIPGARPQHTYDGCQGCLAVAAMRKTAFTAGWHAAIAQRDRPHHSNTHHDSPDSPPKLDSACP